MHKKIMDFFTKGAEIQTQFKESTGSEPLKLMGHHAKLALDNPAFDAAVKKIESDLSGLWKQSSPGDTNKREHVYYELQALARVKGKLLGMFNSMTVDEKIEKRKKSQNDRSAA